MGPAASYPAPAHGDMIVFRQGAPGHEQGVALITAILVVALAAAVVAAMISRQQLDFRRTANVLEMDQISLYSHGVAKWAGQILTRDLRESKTDHLNELWATVLPPVNVENGQLAGFLEDMQGRFNLNSLLVGGEIDQVAQARFRRLLRSLELDEDLATAVIDWLDEDINPGFPGGAEDDVYLGLDPPYRAANTLMTSPSELLLVRGFDKLAYEKLKPHVATLPAPTPVNINTATAQLILSLAEGISEQDAESLILDRKKDGFASVGAFLSHGQLAGREISSHGLSVNSDYFMLTNDIRFGRLSRRYFTLLHRLSDGRTEILLQSVNTL